MSLRRRIRSLFVACALLIVSASGPDAFALSWDVHLVEPQPNPCRTSVAVGKWGIAVLYSDGQTTGARLAWGGPDAWSFEALSAPADSGTWGRCCTLGNGDLFAVWYHTPLGHSLMTARGRPGAGWEVASKEYVGEMPSAKEQGLSLAIDRVGIPWTLIVTRDTLYPNNGLPKLISPTSGTLLANKIIDLDGRMQYSAGASCDIVIDSSGMMHFAYYRTDTMVLKYRNYPYHDNIWTKPRITEGFESLDGVSLLPLPDGSLAAFFKNNSGNVEKRNLCCRIFSGDVWSAPDTLDAAPGTGGFATSLTDRRGKSYVFYSGGTAGGVRMLTDRTGEWRIHVPDPDSVLGSRCAAALSGDAVVVSYWDALSRAVKTLLVRNEPPSAPSGPNPPDAGVLAAPPDALSWNACSDDESDGVSYSVYASDAKWKTDFLEEGAKILSGEAVLSVDLPDSLRDSSPVFWRLVATDTYGAIREGATWSYEVIPSPTAILTQMPSLSPSATPVPTSVPELTPTWRPSQTTTPMVPSPVSGRGEDKTGCGTNGYSLAIVLFLVPLMLARPLDRK